jgi:hypothetical protein
MRKNLKRWKLLGLSALVFLSLTVSLTFIAWSPLELRSKWIREGMTQDQASEVMHRPPDAAGLFHCFWIEHDGEEVRVTMSYANPRHVKSKRYSPPRSGRQSLADELIGHLKRLRTRIGP